MKPGTRLELVTPLHGPPPLNGQAARRAPYLMEPIRMKWISGLVTSHSLVNPLQ
jgi:hypothetical protein